MKFEDIKPQPKEETRKTKMMYYNPNSGEYVTYAQAQNLKKKGIDHFQNEIEVPREDLTPILEEKLRCVNILVGAIDNIVNDK